MALKVNLNIGSTVVSDAYVKVESFAGDKNHLRFVTVIKSCKESEPLPLPNEAYGFDYDINVGNPVEQAYAHLKTLPKFADFVDC